MGGQEGPQAVHLEGPREQGPSLWSEARSRAHLPSPNTPSLAVGSGERRCCQDLNQQLPTLPKLSNIKSSQPGSHQNHPDSLLRRGPPGRAGSLCQSSCLGLPMQGQAGASIAHRKSSPDLAWPHAAPGPEDPGTRLIRNPCWPGCPPAPQRGFPLLSLHCSPPWPRASRRPGWAAGASQ